MGELDSVCVLANRRLLGWQVEALERTLAETDVDVPLVVVNRTEDIDDPGFGRGASPLGESAYNDPDGISLDDFRLAAQLFREEGPWTFVLAEKKLSWLLGNEPPRLMQRHPIEDVDALADAERIPCSAVPVEGNWCDLPDEVVDRIVDETDAVVRFGFNLLTGRIIAEPQYGVLSFHPADIRRHRGIGPAQAFLADADEAGATLQVLTDTIDGGRVVGIETVDVSDTHTLDEIRERVNRLQASMLSTGIERLQEPEFEPREIEDLGPYTSVKTRQDPRFAGRVLAKNVAGRVRKLLADRTASSGPTEGRGQQEGA